MGQVTREIDGHGNWCMGVAFLEKILYTFCTEDFMNIGKK